MYNIINIKWRTHDAATYIGGGMCGAMKENCFHYYNNNNNVVWGGERRGVYRAGILSVYLYATYTA